MRRLRHVTPPDEGAIRSVSIDEPELAGGVWTRQIPLVAREPADGNNPLGAGMRWVTVTGFAGLAAVLIGATVVGLVSVDVAEPSGLLARQRSEGWAVGAPPGVLDLASDCAVPDVPSSALAALAGDLGPRDARFASWNHLELLEAPGVEPPRGSGIRPLSDALAPLCTTDMRVAFARGQALAGLLADAPSTWAVILDLPGPEAVAVATALSGQYEPVWIFAGWPHPKGAWPAHKALGAFLYHREPLIRSATARRPGAPPVLVLDSDRAGRGSFPEYDNRYTASLPPAHAWTRAGVDHLLYVRGRSSDGAPSDLGAALGLLHWTSGIPVQLVALQDFQPMQVPELPVDPGEITWWWGGSPEAHDWFGATYGLGVQPQRAGLTPMAGIPWVPDRPAATAPTAAGHR